MLDRISDKMEDAVKERVFPGAVLLCARGPEIIFHEAFGLADIFDQHPMHKKTIFDLASLTKPLATALVISRLVAQNKISLHQEIGSILQQFRCGEKSRITVDMLLRHTSGLPAYREYFKKIIKSTRMPRSHLRKLLCSEPLENKAGSCQLYSDLGFMILAWIIEEVTGMRIDQAAKEMLFDPLGAEQLFYVDLEAQSSLTGPDAPKRFASTQNCPWRKKVLKAEVDDDNAWCVGGIDGHAGLFGDAQSIHVICCELLRVLRGDASTLLNHDVIRRFVKKKSNFDMVAGFDTPSKVNSSAGSHFSDASIGHLGFTGTSFWIDPVSGLIAILLTNRVHPSRSNEKIKKFRPELHDLIHATIA